MNGVEMRVLCIQDYFCINTSSGITRALLEWSSVHPRIFIPGKIFFLVLKNKVSILVTHIPMFQINPMRFLQFVCGGQLSSLTVTSVLSPSYFDCLLELNLANASREFGNESEGQANQDHELFPIRAPIVQTTVRHQDGIGIP